LFTIPKSPNQSKNPLNNRINHFKSRKPKKSSKNGESFTPSLNKEKHKKKVKLPKNYIANTIKK